MNRETFTVDAALLQELGERLIGRAHIAVAELIKNAYDADAIRCDIRFDEDGITIADDGHGMSEREFLDHWMRIGTTHKVEQETSRLLNRVLTGSKGIGRLSAQFLASEMELWSTSVDRPDQALYAIVDWKNITRGRDLDKFEVLWDMQPEIPGYPDGHPTGTRIFLKGLKTGWDADALERLGREIWVLRSPFDTSKKLSGSRHREDFYIDVDAPGIEDARTAFDTMRSNLFDNWKARIRGNLDQGRRGGQARVTVEFKAGYPDGLDEAKAFNETVTLPFGGDQDQNSTIVDRAKFEILVFRPEGKQLKGIPVGDMREYLARFGNVSVYDTGFRLPYYGSGSDQTGQDWLNIALDQGRRLNASELLPERLKTLNRYMQDLPAPDACSGPSKSTPVMRGLWRKQRRHHLTNVCRFNRVGIDFKPIRHSSNCGISFGFRSTSMQIGIVCFRYRSPRSHALGSRRLGNSIGLWTFWTNAKQNCRPPSTTT